MFFRKYRDMLKRAFRSSPQARAAAKRLTKPRSRPHVEALEHRVTPATHVSSLISIFSDGQPQMVPGGIARGVGQPQITTAASASEVVHVGSQSIVRPAGFNLQSSTNRTLALRDFFTAWDK